MRDLIQSIWKSLVATRDRYVKPDVHTETICPEGGGDCPGNGCDKFDTWKHETTQDHGKLVEEHLRLKAYLIAEKDGFRKDPAVYWEEAQRV